MNSDNNFPGYKIKIFELQVDFISHISVNMLVIIIKFEENILSMASVSLYLNENFPQPHITNIWIFKHPVDPIYWSIFGGIIMKLRKHFFS